MLYNFYHNKNKKTYAFNYKKKKRESVFSVSSISLSWEALGRPGLASGHHILGCLTFFFLALFFNKTLILYLILITQTSQSETL